MPDSPRETAQPAGAAGDNGGDGCGSGKRPNRRIDGAKVLNDLRTALTKYVIFPTDEAADAVTLWTAATHAQDAWNHAPRLAVISPEKRCGKSRLIDVAEQLSHAALVTVNISPAALVRSIDAKAPPTLFIDEADTIWGPKAGDSNEDLRGIVNSGHQRGRPYIRYDIMSRRTERMSTFCMAALAGIGDLPETIMDRAVVIRMRRRAPGETVAPYRTRRDAPALVDIRRRVHDWAYWNVAKLQKAEPEMPVEDRAADTWEPLVAIADLAGGEWPARARKAVMVMVSAEASADIEGSMGIRLLRDVRDVFADWTTQFMVTSDLLGHLKKLDEAPWRELDLTSEQLARRLRPYGVRSSRNSAGSARGYRLDDFQEAFTRYCPSEPVSPSDTAPDQPKPSDGFSASDGSTRQKDHSHLEAEVAPTLPEVDQSDGLTRQTEPTRQTLTRQSDGLTGTDGGYAPEVEIGPAAEVWVSVLRRGIAYHRIDGESTHCGRSVRTGQRISSAKLGDYADLDLVRCPRCWPDDAQ